MLVRQQRTVALKKKAVGLYVGPECKFQFVLERGNVMVLLFSGLGHLFFRTFFFRRKLVQCRRCSAEWCGHRTCFINNTFCGLEFLRCCCYCFVWTDFYEPDGIGEASTQNGAPVSVNKQDAGRRRRRWCNGDRCRASAGDERQKNKRTISFSRLL